MRRSLGWREPLREGAPEGAPEGVLEVPLNLGLRACLRQDPRSNLRPRYNYTECPDNTKAPAKGVDKERTKRYTCR